MSQPVERRAAAMPMRLLFLGWIPILAAASGHATPAVLIEQDRGVFSRSTAIEASEFDEQIASDEVSDFVSFTTTLLSTASTTEAGGDGAVNLDSDLDGDVIEALGSARSDAADTGADARGEAPSDSFFEVIFEAAASEEFVLQGGLDADATLGDGYASIEFVDLDTNTVLATHEAGIGDQLVFTDLGMLTAGTRYRLTAFALAFALSDSAPGAASGDAAYDVTLFLPEPSGDLGLGFGLAALVGLNAWRRRGGP